jgi:hypothetical protein
MEDSKNNTSNNLLRVIALIALQAGAAGSLYIMFDVGRNQKSIVLILLFTGWVLSPFAALFIVSVFSQRWFPHSRKTLYILMMVIVLGSLIGYSGVLSPPGTKAAFVFLVIPLLSWILMGIVAVVSRRRNY